MYPYTSKADENTSKGDHSDLGVFFPFTGKGKIVEETNITMHTFREHGITRRIERQFSIILTEASPLMEKIVIFKIFPYAPSRYLELWLYL